MKINIKLSFLFIAFSLMLSLAVNAKERNGLILTKEGIQKIQQGLGKTPLFDHSLALIKAEVDAEIKMGIETPIPRDFSGGYTHQRHKRNFFMLQKAGVLFQILEDEKYANYVRDMFFQYEAMYKTLPLHPQTRSYARGKLFWQSLNDANWLVYASQAYDAIYEWLPKGERDTLENNLFKPFADHISIDTPQFFNRVHNHSTWGVAAVGMIGLVMQDEELIQRALHGIENDGLSYETKDNDGGFLKVKGQKPGFLSNLNEPFSPAGYYTEGPYYQRYAMYPFLIFAQALHNTRPEIGALEYKDGVLIKAVNVLINLSNAKGEFFAINDAQKGMSYQNSALITAVNLGYYYGNQDPSLLSIAQKHGRVLLDDAGFAVAAAIRDGLSTEFEKTSANYSDGAQGDKGGLALLRYGKEDLTLLFKYTAQGLSHGHYDKLSYSLFSKGNEILQDYGMSRFVNIGQKGGGNYLPENKTWAKQTIAHNTLVQNEVSHFNGSYNIGSQYHSNLHFYDASNQNVQVVSAKETNAYPGTKMHRTMAIIKDEDFAKPLLLDLFKVNSKKSNQYDLPFYYFGQILESNVKLKAESVLKPLGEGHGYQHLYLESKGQVDSTNTKFSWFDNNEFYTLTTAAEKGDEVLLTRIGANDPDYNLRKDPAIIVRRKEAKNTLFASIIEPHGSYSYVSESAKGSTSEIAELTVLKDTADYTVVSIKTVKGKTKIFMLANNNADTSAKHSVKVNGKGYNWVGPYSYTAP